MRFLADGPDIPGDLLYARDSGEVLVFCGAGVSRAEAGGPSFWAPFLPANDFKSTCSMNALAATSACQASP